MFIRIFERLLELLALDQPVDHGDRQRDSHDFRPKVQEQVLIVDGLIPEERDPRHDCCDGDQPPRDDDPIHCGLQRRGMGCR